MKREDIRRSALKLETALTDLGHDGAWENYSIYVGALQSIVDSYPMERAIELEEQKAVIAKLLPKVSDKVFDLYCALLRKLGILYRKM